MVLPKHQIILGRSLFSDKMSNLFFLTGYRLLTGQTTFFALASFLGIPQGHVTADIIIYAQQKLKVDNFQIWQY